MIEIFGSEDFLNENSIAGLSSFLEKFNNKLNADKLISEQGITELENGVLPEGITKERVRLFSERWNRTVLYFESGIMTVSDVPEGESTDFIDWQKLSAYAQRYEEIEEEARNEGFESLVDALFKSYEDVRASIGESSGVCSKVKLELKQKAVLTRDAFDAQLVLDNMTDSSLQNVYVDIIIYDQWGNDVTDKFGFYAPTTQNFYDADENNLGKLSAHSSGQANWIFVPSTECAQGGAETYSVGGVLHYTEGGRDLSIPMVSASITVYPQPELDLLYFWQRDAIADELPKRFDGLAVSTSTFNNLEINVASAHKGRALERFAEHFGWTLDNCMAFGDGLNDLSMVRMAGIGVAMANAAPEVLSAANYVTLSNDEDGVAEALRHFAVVG